MKRSPKIVLGEAVVFGTMTVVLSSVLLYVATSGEKPNFTKKEGWVMAAIAFSTAALLHVGFEISGGNEAFCKKMAKQIQPS